MSNLGPSEQDDERAPLLQTRKRVVPTPLPARQLIGLMSLLLAEPIMSMSILPYINELVTQLPIIEGDKRKVGYYAGFILSLYFVGEAITVLLWSRLSDYIGRKPVLLRGTLGLMIATILFGLSRSFWTLASSRFLAGALNGNIGVTKSMLMEMTDETNIARAFSLIPLTWAMGAIIGPFAGGLLSRPHDRWPELFSHSFWKEFPYFLPCAVTSMYAMASLVIAYVFLKETLHETPPRAQPDERNPDHLSNLEHQNRVPEGDLQVPGSPHRSLLTRPVLLTISIYAIHAYLEISNFSLVPLVYTTPIELGGLGLSPERMATCLAAFGIMTGILPFFFFHRIVRYLGLRRALLTFMSSLVPAFLLFPINGTHAQRAGVDVVTWILLLVHLFVMVGINMTYGCIFMYIPSAAPRGMLGGTNGLSQTVVSIQRAIGPAIAASFFSLSLEYNIMGGYGVFYALTLCTLAALWLASRLPPNGW